MSKPTKLRSIDHRWNELRDAVSRHAGAAELLDAILEYGEALLRALEHDDDDDHDQQPARWGTIGGPAGHSWSTFDGAHVRCACNWSTRASSGPDARAAHVRHVELVAMLANGAL